MKLILAVGALLLSGTALAADHRQRPNVSPNISNVICNQNGAVVTLVTAERFYLGKECDVFWPGRGQGRWWSVARALLIELESETLRLSADAPCKVLPHCQFSE